MQTEVNCEVVFRFCRPSGAPTREPSEGLREALRRLSEADEMQQLVAGARAQQRRVVVEVFHSREGHPLLIHTAVAPRKKCETGGEITVNPAQPVLSA